MVRGDLGKFAAKPIARRVRFAAPFTSMIRDTAAPEDGFGAASRTLRLEEAIAG